MILLHPYYLLLLPLYLIFMWLLNRKYKEVKFSNYNLLIDTIKSSYDYSKILRFLIVLLMVIALANPTEVTIKSQKSSKGYDISLLLDASYSMKEDERFNKAKAIIEEFLKKRKSDNIALTLFANSAYVASPLTYDKASIIKMLKNIELGVAGGRSTALYEALFLGAELFNKSNNKNRVMILLTDGINTVNSVSLDSAIAQVKAKNIKVYTIALGKKGDYNRKVLNKIAKETGGSFFSALKPDELELIYNKIDSIEKAKIETTTYTSYKYYFIYPLVGAFLLLLIYVYLYRGSYNNIFMAATTILLLAAIYRPTTLKFKSIDQQNGEFAIAIDLSNHSLVTDIFPNRLKFSKAKIKELLGNLKGQKVALFAFANSAYLISPPTRDYDRLKFLVENIDPSSIKRDRADFKKLLVAIDKSLSSNPKEVVIFSNGGAGELKEAKEYAIKNSIRVYAYITATNRGDIIKVDGKIVKDKLGNIVVSKANSAFKELASSSGGEWFNYSLSSNTSFAKDLGIIAKESLGDKKEAEELYYIPLLMAFFAFLLSIGINRRDFRLAI